MHSEPSNSKNSISESSVRPVFLTKLAGIVGCIGRTTVRTVKNIPIHTRNYLKRKYKDYKRKPKRKDISRVYVLVGYTTKKHADARYAAERLMITFRRGLLILIFVLLLIISFNAVVPHLDFDQYSQMFGISSVKEATEYDPFVAETTYNNEGLNSVTATPIPTAAISE